LYLLNVKSLSTLVKQHRIAVKSSSGSGSGSGSGGGGGAKTRLVVAIASVLTKTLSSQQSVSAKGTNRRRLERDLFQALGGMVLRVSPGAISDLDRAHVVFFAKAGFNAVEATNLIKRGIKTLRFPLLQRNSGGQCAASAAETVPSTAPLDTSAVCQLESAARLRDAMDSATVVGDAATAYRCLHTASNRLTGLVLATASSGSSGVQLVTTQLLKTVVLRGIHLLEREKRWDQALHYIGMCLSTARACNWTALLVRHAVDLQHMKRPASALEAYESMLGMGKMRENTPSSSGTGSAPLLCPPLQLAAACRIGCERSCKKLSKPPRRWTVPQFDMRTAASTTLTGKRATRGWQSKTGQSVSVEHFVLQEMIRQELAESLVVDGKKEEDAIVILSSDQEDEDVVVVGPSPSSSAPSAHNGSPTNATAVVPCWKGEHCENHLLLTLFGLVTWEALWGVDGDDQRKGGDDGHHGRLYSDTPPGLLHGGYSSAQTHALRALLSDIERDSEFAQATMRSNWIRYKGIQSRGVTWTRFALDDLCAVASGLGSKLCAEIVRVYSQGGGYLAWSSGAPDLMLWRTQPPWQVKFAEVKGPGDSLSDSQCAWMDMLVRNGGDAVVVNVVEEK
jgi:hypothetical protein